MTGLEFTGLAAIAVCILILLIVYAGLLFGSDRR